eukprot:8919649-Pyramimonas_sp.AAC.1
MAFASISDAEGVGANAGQVGERGLPEDHTQGAWIALATEKSVIDNRVVRASTLRWRSSELRRKVSPTLAGETQALPAAVAEV